MRNVFNLLPLRALRPAAILTAATFAVIIEACTTLPPAHTQTVSFDSLSVSRTACFGICPVYTVVVRPNGSVLFTSPNIEKPLVQTIPSTRLAHINDVLTSADFATLPVIEIGKAPYCELVATDLPSTIVTLFKPSGATTRNYYLGCGMGGAPDATRSYMRRLGTIADAVDSVAVRPEWVEASRSRR